MTNGMCNGHYCRWRKHGDVRAHIPLRTDGAAKFCSTGCGRVVIARGYCTTHYQRWRTTGSAGETELIRTPSDLTATEKKCTACRVVKPLEGFHKDKKNLDGRASHCKACYHTKQQESHVKRKYGLTPKQHQAMREAQGNQCPICDRAVKLVVDHCHRGGQVRALLCDRCNRLLGVADDSQDLLVRAVEFLKQHQ